MAKKSTKSPRSSPLEQFPADAIAALRQLAKTRSTDLRWYHDVGVALKKAVPHRRHNAIDSIARGVFKNAKLQPTLYACRKFAQVISRRDLRLLNGLNWAIVHHLIYATDAKRPAVIRAVQKLRKRKAKIGETLTPAEARLIVQEVRGKHPVRRPKLSRIPTLGPKSALREVARLCEEWERHCGAWLQVVARNSRKLERDPEGPKLRREAVEAMRRLQGFLQEELVRLEASGRRRSSRT